MIYLIGSLKNPRIREIAARLRSEGFNVFDDWHAAGPDADDIWQQYERERGRTYKEALDAPHAVSVFEMDRSYLDRASVAVLVLPAGKSAHLELGYFLGGAAKDIGWGFILLDGEPERFDVMYKFADGVVSDVDELIAVLKRREIA